MYSVDCILGAAFVSSSEWIYSRSRSWFNEDHECGDGAIYMTSPEKLCDFFLDKQMYLLGKFLQENFQNIWVHLNMAPNHVCPFPMVCSDSQSSGL